jgi:hypothetical protein
MYLVAIGWIYVVLMVALVEALSSNGTVIGAVFTFLLWGVLPLAIVLYLLRTPARRRESRTRAAEAHERSAPLDPDGGGHPAGHAVAPERKEP